MTGGTQIPLQTTKTPSPAGRCFPFLGVPALAGGGIPQGLAMGPAEQRSGMTDQEAEKIIAQKRAERTDLSGRLYYCSNTADGRKTRKELEHMILKLDLEIDKLLYKEERCF